jgi:hypothetical protein
MISERFSYFPAYELILDELRDYRFFAEDLLHVSKVGADHVFEKLRLCFENLEQRNLSNKIFRELRVLDHRFSSPEKREESITKLNAQIKALLRDSGFERRAQNIVIQ